MEQLLPRLMMVSAVALCFGAFAMGACTHTTDRVVEPVGADSKPATDTSDASVAPIGPVARSHEAPEQEPPPDFSLVREPEVGSAIHSDAHGFDNTAVHMSDAPPSVGGTGGNGTGGGGGNDSRPVSTAGTSYL